MGSMVPLVSHGSGAAIKGEGEEEMGEMAEIELVQQFLLRIGNLVQYVMDSMQICSFVLSSLLSYLTIVTSLKSFLPQYARVVSKVMVVEMRKLAINLMPGLYVRLTEYITFCVTVCNIHNRDSG